MSVSKSKQGVVLIEMLMSLIVVSFIMLLLLSLMSVIGTGIDYQRVESKLLQVSGLMIDDLAQAIKLEVTPSCLKINQNDDVITYCIKGDKMIRQVNGQGYERMLTDVDVQFKIGEIIYLQFKIGEQTHEIPIWSNN